jgi:tetratricopeptide (TPR) repeat protein
MMLALGSRWEKADAHFDSAWEVSFLIESHRRQERYQRDWLLAAGLFHNELVFVGDPAEAFWRADRYLDNAVKHYPEDTEILLAAGALLEWSGSLRYGWESHLKEAEELYSRALGLAPDDPEALLRHGFVLKKLGRSGEARPPLLRLLELSP